MKFLQEVLRDAYRLPDEDRVEEPNPDELDDLDIDDDLSLDDDTTNPEEQDPIDPEAEGNQELDGIEPPDEHPELDGVADDALEDPDRQGLIRTVKNAHLVYKRETEDGTFEELWIYNVNDLRGEVDVKKAILAGTDIPVNRMQSPDGSQTYDVWSAGNAEILMIKGLPN